MNERTSMESLTALLPTDTYPESVITRDANRTTATTAITISEIPIPLYSSPIQPLHSIPEEESDDQLSHSSSCAPTVIHTDYCDSTRLSTPVLDPKIIQDTEDIDQELVKDFQRLDCSRSFFRDLAEGLRAIDSDTESCSNVSTSASIDEKLETVKPKKNMADLDRDQCEIVVNRAYQVFNPVEETLSLNSASISFDHSRDSVLDASLCSNPFDEASIMESNLNAQSSNNANVGGIEGALSATIIDNNIGSTTTAAVVKTTIPEPVTETTRPPEPKITTAHNTMAHESVLKTRSWNLPPPPPPPTLPPPLTSTSTLTSSLKSPFTPDDTETSMKTIISRYGAQTHATDSMRTQPQTYADTENYGSTSAYMDPPPPPPPLSNPPSSYQFPYSSKLYQNPSDARTTDMSRDELDGQRSDMRSRSTIREIPVRAVSSVGPGAATAVEYRSGTTPWGDNFQEYYRKEVMTRTYVTRSTEALSAPPLSRSSPITIPRERYPSNERYYPREERTVDYNYKYTRNIEEEERRIKEDQEKRRQEEDERRRRDEEQRLLWELKEKEYLEKMRKERELRHRELESERLERERLELQRIETDRLVREESEMRRRKEWEKLERDRRALEERELEKKRQLERDRLEKERLEEERLERERLERERLEREKERLERERQEKERLERERIERERIEMERLEIERIERIKRERLEKERLEREKEREEAERKEKERLEKERIAQEKRELLRIEHELKEAQRREAELREAERLAEEQREAQRREQERRDAELLAELQRKAEEKEAQRRLNERLEKERLEALRREQERIEKERIEIERRERQRLEEERREKELLEAQRRAAERREKERLEDERKERERQEEEKREAERRDRERREQQLRERERQIEEQLEREKLAALERAAQERRAARQAERDLEGQREMLERKAQELKERERLENERRERERLEEERTFLELKERERRNAELRERERREAEAKEAARRREDRRSRDKLDQIAREIEEKERMEIEKQRLLREYEDRERRRQMLTSHETLEKLTKAPYYSRENLPVQPYGSRENVGGEVTTKVERQVIERVDRTYWTDDPRYQRPSVSGDSPDTDFSSIKERMYQRRLNDDEDFNRGSSRRSSKYRSKMEKARKDFLCNDVSPSSDPLSDRFRMSTDDPPMRPPAEYRGPLLQKFNSNEFATKTDFRNIPYGRVGPSPYDEEYRRLFEKVDKTWAAYRQRMSQPNLYSRSLACSTSYLETNLDTGTKDVGSIQRQVDETNLDDVHRSNSVMDYERQSRRDLAEAGEPVSHVRSKSADYLMDRKMREESAPPENELQKFGDKISQVSEHELRFRKSTEKLHVPDWYREKRTGKGYDLDASISTTTSEKLPYSEGENASRPYPISQYEQPRRSVERNEPLQLPAGMFDKYKDEIEEMRRSRTSLHQVGSDRKVTKEQPKTVQQEQTTSYEKITSSSTVTTNEKQLPGYTVTAVPTEWNIPRERNSRVVEVADTFVGAKNAQTGLRYGGRVTIEEVLDSIFYETKPSAANYDNESSLPYREGEDTNFEGPGIYTQNYTLMKQVSRDPAEAEHLLRNERLYIRCARCHKTRELPSARLNYISCKHCYTYYCSKACRELDWSRHSERCSFARINTLCKDVIMKVRSDREAQWFMSKIAREGYASRGRGSVSLRLTSPQLAEQYVRQGWAALAHFDTNNLLFYYTVDDLVDERKEPSLIALCRKYDPTDKFILSVSIIADMGKCPQTPPLEATQEQTRGADVTVATTPPSYRDSNLMTPTWSFQSPQDEFRTAVPTEV